MTLRDKLGIWAFLLLAGGAGFLCANGSRYFLETAASTLSKWSTAECAINCKLQLGTTADSPATDQPSAAPANSRWIALPVYASTDVALAAIQVQLPHFFEARIDKLVVRGLSGLSTPEITVFLTFEVAKDAELRPGQWPVRLNASAALSYHYLAIQLRPAQQEFAALAHAGSAAERRRALDRVEDLALAGWELSKPHSLVGETVMSFDRVSNLAGPMSRWLGWLLGTLAFFFLGSTAVVAFIYLKRLTAGRIEPF